MELPNPSWQPVPASERPRLLYHGTSAERAERIERQGLRPRKSRHRVPARDTQPLVFLAREPEGAEWWARGGPIYELELPADAPLFVDPKFVDSFFTTVAIAPERLRRVSRDELIARARARVHGQR